MDDEQDPIKLLEKGFDVVVMGTGLTETILSGIMSVEKKRVLHIDSNDYYGGEGASLKMSQLFTKFVGESAKAPATYKDRDWNIDLIPKFLMAGGELARILRQLKQVQENVQFQQIAGSYVYRASGAGILGMGGSGIHKVPSSASEALSSTLIGMFEKTRLKKFLEFVANYDDNKGPLYQGINLEKDSMKSIYDQFSLESGTRNFVGHAMALYSNDDYLDRPARATFNRIRLYASSVALYGKSPYIYPLYGLGELPSAFTRLSAVHGGTYMLNTKVLDFEYEDGKVSGVKINFENPKADGEFIDLVIKTPLVLADPSYVAEGRKKKVTGQKVARAICVLKHSVKDTNGADSAQIIIPQSEVGRKHDIYIAVVSHAHNVCPQGYWLAIVSTITDTDNPQHELKAGFDLLEPIEETFMGKPVTLWEQADDASDNIFVSRSFDASSHFESCTDDVKELYRRMEGKELDIDGLGKATVTPE
ncbi:hypothetical protein ABW19_dt0201168 [Dactylella cylindrospora]|nr:hypothetical protein ABW19_dt0201168 [Dactylella cylindrospora]